MRRPVSALRVKDLDAALRFYCDGLGFALDLRDACGVAQVAPPKGLPLLLAVPAATDLAPWLLETWRPLEPGQRVYLTATGDLQAYRSTLTQRGLQPGELIAEPDGGRVLELTDPDGYVISFWQPPVMPDPELISRYATAPALLEEALAGLTEAGLDLARAPGKWTIRQLVHHMADSDASSLVRILMALAEPGRGFANNPYSQDRWVEGLGSAHRPVASSVNLIKAVRAHVTGLVEHLPEALDRSIETTLAGTITVREMLQMLGSHIAGHADQIRETRRVHGV